MSRSCQESIKAYAKALGFDLVGFSKPKIEQKYLDALRAWQSSGNHADMSYMEEFEKRANLNLILPGIKSVIVLGMNYYYDQPSLKPNHGRIARYAYGRDYHKIITKKLKKLCAHLSDLDPTATHKPYVDTGPVLERALAEQAGLGHIAKNSLLITREYGSWVFLAEILTTMDFTISGRSENPTRPFPLCGQCTKCIDACPTGAIISPGVIDARLCISYLTIENRDKIPPHLAAKIAQTKRIFGCDICQEVCPHNEAKQRPHQNLDLTDPAIATDQLPFAKIPTTDSIFLDRFTGSPLMRAKRKGLERNVGTMTASTISRC